MESVSLIGIEELVQGLYVKQDEQPAKAVELINRYIELKKISIKRFEDSLKSKIEKRLPTTDDRNHLKDLKEQLLEAERVLDMIKKDFGV